MIFFPLNWAKKLCPGAEAMAQAPENLTTFIEHKIRDEVDNKSQILATKEDLSKLEEALSKLEIKIGETKVDLIKWIFAFWITLALMIIGLYLKN